MKKQFAKKTIIALSAILMSISSTSHAVLDNTTTLNIDTGSFFTMGGSLTVAAPGFDGQFLTGNEGLVLGTTQTPSGSHSGAVNGTESPTVDNAWLFFNSTGMSGSDSNTNVLSATGNTATVDMSGWVVAWNGLDAASGAATVPMGSGAWLAGTTDGVANIVCGVDCGDGDTYTLTYSATVPAGDPSNFGTTPYLLSLTGTITDTNTAPVIGTPSPYSTNLEVNTSTTVDITASVSDAQGIGTVDYSSLTFSSNTCAAANITHDNNGAITFADTSGTVENCSFQFQVSDNEGRQSNTGTVNIAKTASNPPPTTVADVLIVQKNTSNTIDVTANDTDADGLNKTTVAANLTQGNNGATITADTSGVVTYNPATNFIGSDSFTYTIEDTLGNVSSATSVNITVNDPPVAIGTSISVARNATVTFNVNVSDSDGAFDLATLAISNNNCTASITDDGAGEITYTDTSSAITSCTFDYTVNDDNGGTSNLATMAVSVINTIPVATNETIGIDTASANSIAIDIAANDTDADGTIVRSSIQLVSNTSSGTISINDPTAGNVTYTPNSGFTGQDSFTYSIDDNDGATSNTATVTINVSNTGTFFLPPNAILSIEPATVGNSVLVQPDIGTGSWFSMLLSPGSFTHTSVSGLNHLQLGTTQLGSINPAVGNIDDPWPFVGNTGLHQTTSDVNVISDPGDGTATLDFSGWNVAWAGVPSINLSVGPSNGIASIVCAAGNDGIADCSIGDTYTLEYQAIVPEGDPSNFGGVNYRLHLEGSILAEAPNLGGGNALTPYDVVTIVAADSTGNVVSIAVGDTAASVGNTIGTGMSVSDIGIVDPLLNPENGEQCAGGCIDFVITGVTPGEYIDIVYLLSKPIQTGSVYRKLINGNWQTFDKTTGDTIGSAAAVSNQCQSPAGRFSSTLVAGNECIIIHIKDGGPNDADGLENGIIVDPSGILVAGTPNTPAGGTDGCSMSGNTVSLMERTDWLLVFAFIIWLGLVIRKNQA